MTRIGTVGLQNLVLLLTESSKVFCALLFWQRALLGSFGVWRKAKRHYCRLEVLSHAWSLRGVSWREVSRGVADDTSLSVALLSREGEDGGEGRL